jgi:hypothetical protein
LNACSTTLLPREPGGLTVARIRSLKPEALQHRKVGRLSDRAFRLWVGMLTQADDDGRLIADPEQLRVWCWAYRSETKASHVEDALQEVARAGLVRVYADQDGIRLVDFPSWRDHQRIHRHHYTPSKLAEYHNNGTGTVPVRDRYGTDTVAVPLDRIGSDRIGSEGIGGGVQRGGQPARAGVNTAAAADRMRFRIPPRITSALDDCPVLGSSPRLRAPVFWQSQVRAFSGLDFAKELRKAEAYLASKPAKAKRISDHARFVNNWFSIAAQDLPSEPPLEEHPPP